MEEYNPNDPFASALQVGGGTLKLSVAEKRVLEKARQMAALGQASPGGMDMQGNTGVGYEAPAAPAQPQQSALPQTRLSMPPPPPSPAMASALPLTNSVMTGQPAPQQSPQQSAPRPQAAPGGTLRQSVSLTTAQRGGGGAPATGGVGWDSYLGDLRDKRKELDAQLEDAYRPPDYSTLQAQAMQRGQDATRSSMAGILAGMGPQGAQGFTKGMAARAAELAGNMKVAGGEITGEGEVMLDPGFQAQRKIELLAKRIDALDRLEQSALSAQEKAALARQAQADRMEMRRLVAAVSMSKREGGGGKLQMSQFVNKDTGAPLSYDQSSGALYEVVMTPQGARTVMVDPRNVARHGDVPATGVGGDTLPGTAPAQDRSHYTNASRLANTMPGLIEEVKKNKDAFGVRVGVAEKIGGTMGMGGQQVPLVGKDLTEKQQATRAQVYLHYGRLLNELIGTAQTPAETTRLLSFVPGPNEDADGIVRKMQGAIEEATKSRASLRQNYGLTPAPGNSSLPGARGASFESRYGVPTD